jgi:ribonuclease HI
MTNKTLTINTDGGSRGNPGPAAYAFVVRDTETNAVMYEQQATIGIATNNKAEYTAVMKAFEWLISNITNNSNGKINFILDSELVVRQLNGIYKIKDKNIMEYVKMIKESEKKLAIPISYTAVRRAENKEADALVNKALDEEFALEGK